MTRIQNCLKMIQPVFSPSVVSFVVFTSGSLGLAKPLPECSSEVLKNVLAPATAASAQVSISCSLHLRKEEKITKQLILKGSAASNAVVDCGGGSIGVPGKSDYGIHIFS